jgi:hypothetical protein
VGIRATQTRTMGRNRATLVAGHTISEATLSLRTDPEITCQTTISPGDLAARHANTSSRYRRNWDHRTLLFPISWMLRVAVIGNSSGLPERPSQYQRHQRFISRRE